MSAARARLRNWQELRNEGFSSSTTDSDARWYEAYRTPRTSPPHRGACTSSRPGLPDASSRVGAEALRRDLRSRARITPPHAEGVQGDARSTGSRALGETWAQPSTTAPKPWSPTQDPTFLSTIRSSCPVRQAAPQRRRAGRGAGRPTVAAWEIANRLRAQRPDDQRGVEAQRVAAAAGHRRRILHERTSSRSILACADG